MGERQSAPCRSERVKRQEGQEKEGEREGGEGGREGRREGGEGISDY